MYLILHRENIHKIQKYQVNKPKFINKFLDNNYDVELFVRYN